MKLLKENKLVFGIIFCILGLYIWAEIGGFRILKDDKGIEWSSSGNNAVINHK